MKPNNFIFLGLITIAILATLSGCGKSSAVGTTDEDLNASSTTSANACSLIYSEASFIQAHQNTCKRSVATKTALSRYYRGLKSLEGAESKKIERELITLKSWSNQIASLSASDTECAKTLLCGGQ